MAQWIGILLTAIGLALGQLLTYVKQATAAASREARMSERMDFMKGEIIHLQNESQTPDEREALARFAHSELEAHEREDFQKFKAIDDRMVTLANNWDRKLDMILSAIRDINR